MDKDSRLIFEALQSKFTNPKLIGLSVKLRLDELEEQLVDLIKSIETFDSIPASKEVEQSMNDIMDAIKYLQELLDKRMHYPKMENEEGPEMRVTSPDLRPGTTDNNLTPLDPGSGSAFSRGGKLGGGLRRG